MIRVMMRMHQVRHVVAHPAHARRPDHARGGNGRRYSGAPVGGVARTGSYLNRAPKPRVSWPGRVHQSGAERGIISPPGTPLWAERVVAWTHPSTRNSRPISTTSRPKPARPRTRARNGHLCRAQTLDSGRELKGEGEQPSWRNRSQTSRTRRLFRVRTPPERSITGRVRRGVAARPERQTGRHVGAVARGYLRPWLHRRRVLSPGSWPGLPTRHTDAIPTSTLRQTGGPEGRWVRRGGPLRRLSHTRSGLAYALKLMRSRHRCGHRRPPGTRRRRRQPVHRAPWGWVGRRRHRTSPGRAGLPARARQDGSLPAWDPPA